MIPLKDIVERLDDLIDGRASIPLSDLVEVRHKLTANIKNNLYGQGDREEGRVALTVRATLDRFLFDEKPLNTPGWQHGIESLKRAIILDTFLELIDILDRAREVGGGTGKGIKAAMGKLVNDSDRLDRFHNRDKAAIWQVLIPGEAAPQFLDDCAPL